MNINFEKTIINKRSRTLTQLAQSTRRLNSGYRINSAADDAAGLAVSEKLRSIDVGLRQGLRNISDGMNFLATQDSAEQVINDSLHRLKEIAVEAANGTNSRIDREALDLEYQQILDEIGDITATGDFNGVPLFDQHMPEYSKFAGKIEHTEFIDVVSGKNSPLIVNYTENGATKSVSLSIPSGRWSADEIADMIDDQLYEMDSPLIIGVNSRGQFSIQCEGGYVNYISGPGRSLFYDVKEGSTGGYLLGVTKFRSETAQLDIEKGYNDLLKFRIEGDSSDTVYEVNLLNDGETKKGFNYRQLIDRMNESFEKAGLKDTVTAVAAKNSDGENVIGLSSVQAITGLEGNFIMLEPTNDHSSALYDISSYSTVKNTSAKLDAAKPLGDEVNILRERNDYFVVDFSYYVGKDESDSRTVRFDLLETDENAKTFTRDGIIDRINSILAEEFKDLDSVPVKAKLTKNGGIAFETTQFGEKCDIKLNTTDVPSGYMLTDLFDAGRFTSQPAKVKDSYYTPASCTGRRNISSVNIDDKHNKLQYTVTLINPDTKSLTSVALNFELQTGSYSGQGIVDELNKQLAAKISGEIKNKLDQLGWGELKTDMKFELSGNGLALKANGEDGADVSAISVNTNQNVSTGYRKLIRGVSYSGSPSITNGKSYTYQSQSSSSVVYYYKGSNAGEDYYTAGNNTSKPAQSGDFLTYEYRQPQAERGGYTGSSADVIDDKFGTPATLTYPGALSQFVTNDENKQVCLRDTDVRFTLSNGTELFDVNVKVTKGTTIEELCSAIETASGDRVKVTRESGSLVISSVAKGNNMEFISYAGNMAATATQHRPSGSYIDYDKNTYTVPPSLTLGSAGSNIPLDLSKGNIININVGGSARRIELTGDKINFLSDLATQIGNQIGSDVSVSTSGSGIVITGGKGVTGDITFDQSSTCPIDREFHKATTTAQPGSASLPYAGTHTHISLTIVENSNDTFTFSYTTPDGGTKPVSVKLPSGATYSSVSSLANDLNTALPESDRANVSISGSNGRLTITTEGKGAGYSISSVGGNMGLDKAVTTASVPSGSNIDHKNNIVNTAATVTNSSFGRLFNEPYLEIISGENDAVVVSVSGHNPVTVKLTEGRYSSSSSILSQLRSNKDLTDIVDIVTSGNTLTLRSKDTGSNVSISVAGTTAPIFQIPNPDNSHLRNNRNYSLCQINGNANAEGVKINSWDNKMTFKYKAPSQNGSGEHELTIEIPPKDSYTAAELADEIQKSINSQIPEGNLEVTVLSGGRISIKGATITDNRSIWEFEGPLYDKVFQAANFTVTSRHRENPGATTGNNISYIIGRNPMEPETEDEIESGCNVMIYPGLNDKFTFDLKYNAISKDENGVESSTERVIEVNLTLPGGEYDRQKIADTVQELTRQQLPYLDNTLDPEGFRATIGLGAIGVPEPDNLATKSENRLILSYTTPDNGSIERDNVRIEGIRGNLAYRIFYQATETPCPTQIVGAANIRDGVNIQYGVNSRFTVGFNGERITVDLPSGFFTGEQIVNILNSSYESMGSEIRTVMKGDNLMIYSLENGEFNIDPICGNAAYDLFYGGESRGDDTDYIGIHSGRRTDSYIWYQKTRLDQHLMRINTTGVTTIDRALKAISRLDKANAYLLKWRGLNGANENRSARTYDRNNVLIENLENSESALRDTDMAEEYSKLQKQQIIQQFQDNLMVQTKNIATEMVLNQLNQKG